MFKSCLVIIAIATFFQGFNLSGIQGALQEAVPAKTKPEHDEATVVKLILEGPEPGEYGYRAVGQAGALQAGKRYLLKLEVENPFDHDIEFTTVSPGCSCTDFDFDAQVFKAGVVTKGSLVYITPNFSSKGKLLIGLSLLNRGTSPKHVAATVTIHGELKGVIDFGRANHNFEVTSDRMEFEIPVFFTAPVASADLTVSSSQPLRDVVTKIEPVDENNAIIRFMVPKIALPDSGISGLVSLRHEPTKTSREISVTFYPQLPIVFRPTFLTFRKSANEGLVATALVQIRLPHEGAREIQDSQEAQGNDNTSEDVAVKGSPSSNLDVQCEYDGRLLGSSATYLANQIWRIKIDAGPNDLISKQKNEDQTSDDDSALRCRIKVDGKAYELSVPFLLVEVDR